MYLRNAMWILAVVILCGVPRTGNADDVSGDILHDGSGTGLYFVWAFRAGPNPMAGADVRPHPGPYEIPDLPGDTYFIFAWRDFNGNGWPSTNEPIGWFGSPWPEPVHVEDEDDVEDIDVELKVSLFQAELTGTVHYSGAQQGRIWIVPHWSPQFVPHEIAGTPWTIHQPEDDYWSFVFKTGDYYVSAWMDVNRNLKPDFGEPFGTHQGAVSVTQSGVTHNNIDIFLFDTAVSVEESTWSRVKALYSR